MNSTELNNAVLLILWTYLKKYCLYFQLLQHTQNNFAPLKKKKKKLLLLWQKCYWVIIGFNTVNFWVTYFFLQAWQYSSFASLILKYRQLSHCKTFRKTAISAILFSIFLLLPGLHIATKLLLAICKHMWRCGVCMTQGPV